MSTQNNLNASDELASNIAHEIRMAEHDAKFLASKIESELLWLEGHIRDIRQQVERGNVFEQRNLVAKAADVAEYAGKLRGAHDRLAAFKGLTPKEPTA